MIHANSIESFYALDKSTRQARVLDVFRSHVSPLTDRQVAKRLGFEDMNMVRPRITELIEDEKLIESGKVFDHITRRSVRTTRFLRPEEVEQRMLF